MVEVSGRSGQAGGRPPSTSRARLERVAFELFAERGFEATSVEDIAAAAGIGRRTFFRYFGAKNDTVWGEFDAGLERMRAQLAAAPQESLLEAVRTAVKDFNVVPAGEEGWHRQRMSLIMNVPALYANSAIRFTQWRAVVAEFAAARLGVAADALGPTLIGHCALGASLSAYEQWLARPGTPLPELFDEAFGVLAAGLEPVVGGAA